MAKGDVAVTLTLPPDIDKMINKLAVIKGVTRREVVIQAVTLLAAQR